MDPPPRGNDGVVEVQSGDIDPSAQAGWPALQGPHNAQNAAVALAVARALGIDEATIEQGLQSYASPPHRMQQVRAIGIPPWRARVCHYVVCSVASLLSKNNNSHTSWSVDHKKYH